MSSNRGPAYIRECVHPRSRHEHGTEVAYCHDACRCNPCRDAHAVAQAARRRQIAYGRPTTQMAPAVVGCQRRLQALMRNGWSCACLADILGIHPTNLYRVLVGSGERMMPATAARIVDLYDDLWDKVPTVTDLASRISASRTRNLAERRGYLPALAWDDDEIDDPNAKPQQPPVEYRTEADPIAVEIGRPVTPADRRAVVADLVNKGLTAEQISARVGLSTRTVTRLRSAA